MWDCNCYVCSCCIDPVNDVYPCCDTMIWLWQVFRWSILSTPHGHCVPSLVLSLGWWNSYCWSLCPQSAPCLLLRSPTKNSHNKLSARLSTPPLDWVTALEPPPSLMPISAPLQKCAIFLWRVFELTATGRCWCSARWCLAAFCWSPLLRWQLLSTQLREMPADDRSQGWVSSDHQSSADQSVQLIHSIAACSHCSHTSYSWQAWLPVGQNVTNWCWLVVST